MKPGRISLQRPAPAALTRCNRTSTIGGSRIRLLRIYHTMFKAEFFPLDQPPYPGSNLSRLKSSFHSR